MNIPTHSVVHGVCSDAQRVPGPRPSPMTLTNSLYSSVPLSSEPGNYTVALNICCSSTIPQNRTLKQRL